tara:strand:+ start:3692 stop:4621 length:930 start_codon:yes stop_codon:yes gene_type:complete
MKIFLTGGTGMVGKNILENESSKLYDIVAPQREELDLLNKKSVFKYIKKNKPDIIIHAAGIVGGIEANINNPVKFLKDNIDIGINLISASLENGVDNFLNLSSSCMYPKDAENPLKEDLILKGQLEPTNEGYALAKIVTTRLCEYISRENLLKNYKTIIPCNLYGKYDNYEPESSHLIPAIIYKIHQAKENNQTTIKIWGDGNARREFMYAGELANFIFYAIENIKDMPQNINVGIGRDYSIKEYYDAVLNEVRHPLKFEYDLNKPVGMKQKLVNIEKLKNFGWSSKLNLDEGIKMTYKFFKEGIEDGL